MCLKQRNCEVSDLSHCLCYIKITQKIGRVVTAVLSNSTVGRLHKIAAVQPEYWSRDVTTDERPTS